MSYKARYVIDIDLSEKLDGTDECLERMFRVKLQDAKQDFVSRFDKQELEDKFDYVERHFPRAALSLFFELLWLEADAHIEYSPNVRKIVRDLFLKELSQMRDTETRKRLTPKPPFGKAKPDEIVEKERLIFERKCIIAIQAILRNYKVSDGLRIKTKVAEKLFSNQHSHPTQALNRTLDKYGLKFENLIDAARNINKNTP